VDLFAVAVLFVLTFAAEVSVVEMEDGIDQFLDRIMNSTNRMAVITCPV
jgi:hypothetical protein